MTETVIVRIMRRRPLTIKWSSDVRVFNIIPNPVFCLAHPTYFPIILTAQFKRSNMPATSIIRLMLPSPSIVHPPIPLFLTSYAFKK